LLFRYKKDCRSEPVRTPADPAAGAAENREDDPGQQQNDPDGPEDGDAEHKAGDQQDDSECDHGTPLLV
jgi:hypothetical protein